MLRYLLNKRKSTCKTEKQAIPIETIKEALTVYLTPFPGFKDIVDIDFKDVPDIIHTTIYYRKEISLRPKKTE